MRIFIIALLLLLPLVSAAHPQKYKDLVKLEKNDDTVPSTEIGARVFYQRCSMCHGTQGMGEGRVALKLKLYPSTNIMLPKKAINDDELFDIIVYGSLLDNVSSYMPPFGNELTWTEVKSVVEFVSGLRKDPEKYLSILEEQERLPSKQVALGKNTYEMRCTLCHGINADGNGRMAKIIKTPPPYNLLLSRMPAEYLTEIISKGGEPLGRSKQMPPWGEQLSSDEIDAVVSYIIGLRTP